MKIYIFVLMLPIFAIGQTQSENYILKKNYKAPTLTSIPSPTILEASQEVNYFDGLGRPTQKIIPYGSASSKNIVVPYEYDEFGRQAKDYLPYASQTSGLNIESSAINDVLNFPQFQGEIPYSEKLYDASPLNKVLKQSAPGNDWSLGAGHEIKFDENGNVLNEVKLFRVSKVANSYGTYNYSLLSDGYYKPNTLYKSTIKNENWVSGKNNTTEEFKDVLGKTILKRSYNNNDAHDTYYVYDSDKLIYVIPPLASDTVVQIQSSSQPYTYSKSFNYSDFLIDASGNPFFSGGGSMSITIQNNIIKLTFSFGSGSATLDLNKEFPINAVSPIPDMTLGFIDVNYNGNHQFIAKIINNKLKFEDYTPNDPTQFFTSLIAPNLSQPLNSSDFPPTIIYSATVDFNPVENLGYQYKYDYRNRLAAKKLPGKQWEFIVYDKLDRPVATGPAFSPYGDGTVGMLITEYDVFGRVIQTGWRAMTVNESTRGSWQNDINGGSNPFILTTGDILTKNFYDNYAFTGAPTIPNAVEAQNVATNVKGLVTGSWVRVLTNASSLTGETSYILYDTKYRPIRNYTSNYLGGYTQVDNKLNFIGKTIYTVTTHKRAKDDDLLRVEDNFTYTPQDRLLTHTQQINKKETQLIVSNNYDELGQLISKNVGGTDVTGATGLQKVDYAYNIRGWLKSINDTSELKDPDTGMMDLFAFQIRYNNSDFGANQYNGNISETYWRSNTDNILRKYAYLYDHLNRLNNSYYQKPESNLNEGSYDEYISYDKNGNIQSLNRTGELDSNGIDSPIQIDNLTYTYHSTQKNQLMKVMDYTNNPNGFKDDSNGITDPLDDYAYDANGNMIKDDNKGITAINYNHLNLPTKIIFGGTNGSTTTNNQSIEYIYNALGEKITKKVTYANAASSYTNYTNYLSGFIYDYKSDRSGTSAVTLKSFNHPEGYVEKEMIIDPNDVECFCTEIESYNYVFQYKDHLGNIRLSYSDKNKDNFIEPSEILEENNYYPFGLKHNGYNNDVNTLNYSPLKYRFQGQERQDELGLNWDSFKYRNYDYAIGRFMSIDPLAEKYAYQSPYNFSENRVIDAREFEGLEKVSVHLLGNLSYNGSSSNIVANVSMDMGNKNSVAFRLSVQGIGNINGTYSQKEGFKYNVSKYNPDMNDAWASTMVKGIKIPDFIAKWGINQAKDDLNSETVEEIIARTNEQEEMNETMNYILTSAYELIDNDIMDAYYSLDGTISGKFQNFTFSHGKFRFKGNFILEYKEPFPTKEKKEEKKKEEKKEDKKKPE